MGAGAHGECAARRAARLQFVAGGFLSRCRTYLPDSGLGAELNAPIQQAPHDLGIEQALLGAILLNADTLSAIDGRVEAEDFFEPVHRELFDRFREARDSGSTITPALAIAALGDVASETVIADLTVGKYVARLATEGVPPNIAKDYANTVRRFAQRRKLLELTELISTSVAANVPPNEAAAQIIDAVDAIAAEGKPEHQQAVSIGRAADFSIDRMTHAMQHPGRLRGVSTGLADVDRRLSGLQPGDFIILAGRPGMGKTALACGLIRSAAATDPSMLFSLEMGAAQIADRMLADVTFSHSEPISYFDISNGTLSDKQAERIIEAREKLSALPIIVDPQSGLSVSQIAARARKEASRLERMGRRLGLIAVDHIGLVRPSDRYRGNRVHEVTETSGALKSLAKELDVPVVGLCQLSRRVEERDNKRPQLSDLRDSGSLEQDADVVLFVYREAYYLSTPCAEANDDEKRIARLMEVRHDLELNVAKQRNGPVGTIKLFCNVECNAIRNLARAA